jgi:uncharacterized protein YoaH (UPF0181 family)
MQSLNCSSLCAALWGSGHYFRKMLKCMTSICFHCTISTLGGVAWDGIFTNDTFSLNHVDFLHAICQINNLLKTMISSRSAINWCTNKLRHAERPPVHGYKMRRTKTSARAHPSFLVAQHPDSTTTTARYAQSRAIASASALGPCASCAVVQPLQSQSNVRHSLRRRTVRHHDLKSYSESL